MPKLRPLFIICTLCITATLCAQGDPQNTITRARTFYEAGRYDSTAKILSAYVKAHGRDSSSLIMVPLLMESAVRLGDNGLVHRLAAVYTGRYSDAPFTSRVWYLDGIACGRMKDVNNALTSFSRASTLGLPRNLDTLMPANLASLVNINGTAKVFFAVTSQTINRKIEELTLIALAGTSPATESSQKAQELLKQKYSGSPALAKQSPGTQLTNAFTRFMTGEVTIGCIAPLSGSDSDAGKSILQGAQIAIDQVNLRKELTVRMQTFDTRGSMIDAGRITADALDQKKLKFILGPVLSSEAATAFSQARCSDAVCISPTASEDGLAQLGRNAFQLNITPMTMTRTIARYAATDMHIKDFIIIAPATDEGLTAAKNFRESVEQLGGTILAQEQFTEGTPDLKEQFVRMRATLLDIRNKRMGIRMSERERSGFLTDSTLDVGAIFIPVQSEDVATVATQAFFHKIKGQLLGTAGWQSDDVLIQGKRYVQNAIFSSSMRPLENSVEWQTFKNSYAQKYGIDPDRIAALGYDACMLMISAIERSGSDPSAVARTLESTQNFLSTGGPLSIDPQTHATASAAIMKITEKGIIRLE